MKRLCRRQHGQAFTELALALALFLFLLMSGMQMAMLGAAQIRCHQAARRAAWLWNTWNNADPQGRNLRSLQALLPGLQAEDIRRVDPDSNREAGMAYEVSTRVPAVGWFHLIHPSDFKISARCAVIAYNPKPIVTKGLGPLKRWAKEELKINF